MTEIAGLFLGFFGGLLALLFLPLLLAPPLSILLGLFRDLLGWLRCPSRRRFAAVLAGASLLSLFVLAISLLVQLVCWSLDASSVVAATRRIAGWSLLACFFGFPLAAWLLHGLDPQESEGEAGQPAAGDGEPRGSKRES